MRKPYNELHQDFSAGLQAIDYVFVILNDFEKKNTWSQLSPSACAGLVILTQIGCMGLYM